MIQILLSPHFYESWKTRKKMVVRKNLRKALAKSGKLSVDFSKFNIPYFDWTLKYRTIIEGHPNVLKYLPMWHEPYRDTHPWIMFCIARQLGKTTLGGGL